MCLQNKPIKYVFSTSLACADAGMEAQVTLVWNYAQQSATFCSWATEAMLNTALLFTGKFLWLVQLLPKTHANRRVNWSNYSGWFLLYSAMPRFCCFLRQEEEMTKMGLWHFLTCPHQRNWCLWLSGGCTRSFFTVDISKSPHLLSLITKQAQPMSSCFSLPALSCKVLLSTWDLLFIGLFRTCSEFKQWRHMFRCSVVLSNYLPCRT